MRLIVFTLAATLLGTAAISRDTPTPQQKLEAALAGLVPGKPVSCLGRQPSASATAYGATILYKVSRTEIYRTDTGGGCERAGHDDILVTVTSDGRACRGDIVRMVDPQTGQPAGSCTFGDFTPYRRPAR